MNLQMRKINIHLVIGARPNFMKAAPIYHAFKGVNWATLEMVNTGQHTSPEMSEIFLRDLMLPVPTYSLGSEGHSHAEQTSSVMTKYETLCVSKKPDLVIVIGDVNSTLAATLAAAKLNIPVAHLEAGLRSGDKSMPEEINRRMVDAVANILWTPSADADGNLINEGVKKNQITRVGNVMIDAYCLMENKIESEAFFSVLDLEKLNYILVTMHRPVNVDSKKNLESIVSELLEISKYIPIVFPMHPRTNKNLEIFGLLKSLKTKNIKILSPLGYIQFMSLVVNSMAVITDSGGVQEETSYLGIPCFTARNATERPITIIHGTNKLIAIEDMSDEIKKSNLILEKRINTKIPLWDGFASQRIMDDIKNRWLSSTLN